MRLAIDAMGGDNAPNAIVDGVYEAIEAFPDLSVTIVGDEEKLNPLLKGNKDRVAVLHTEEYITSEDQPVKAVRRKKNASMVLAVNEVKEGRADAAISAGNTGALMAAGLLYVGRIKGIDRPGLAPTLPTIDEKGFVLLDVGANMDAKPEHLLQYAHMGSIYAEKVRGVNNPRVGLLNIGTEEGKGNELSKEAYALLQGSGLNFVGNVESRDILGNEADVVVCDGFSGNLVLKTIEGTALTMFKMLKEELTSSITSKMAAGVLKPKLKNLKSKLDYSEYGGAGLFGLRAPVIKAHGSSNGRAVFSAIKQARMMVTGNVVSAIQTSLKQEGDQ
ncbi:phosphate acyltransferase PlsX [Guptibacillus hwajinpoensis]|uniref:Phosphate acyltransferase n=1 Tax=Guptibacillus hwajinpoensis TaxID=208199 RepID=A0ABU0K0H6_9BACL|nr:phosphate acyltransferase PlsX [Alkalihalobacillus hemicentroti]MDQ0482855.1 glycerol-3-phosphate acyltransferase PlsX [Alkalihalobacillus hemicentroti]